MLDLRQGFKVFGAHASGNPYMLIYDSGLRVEVFGVLSLGLRANAGLRDLSSPVETFSL